MNRRDFQRLAQARLREARKLLKAGEPSGSYYLSGYAIECALKACISRQVRKSEWPDLITVRGSHTHVLENLVGLSGLSVELEQEQSGDKAFHANWLMVKDWRAESRYRTWSRLDATDMVDAVGDPNHGVLQWVQRYW